MRATQKWGSVLDLFPVPALLCVPPLVLLNDARSNDARSNEGAAFSPLGRTPADFLSAHPKRTGCVAARLVLLQTWGRAFRNRGEALIAVAPNKDSL
jgi:hypothetical protein